MEIAKLEEQKIDKYRIVRHIARGGMADVYLAHDEILQRDVAFKVMLDSLAVDEQFVRRFEREARTVAKLNHPNIVQVYDSGITPGGQPYITMQIIEGGSLQEKLAELAERDKLFTTEQVLNIVRHIAVALEIAHKNDVVHRDLKPGNILIREDGTPVLVDLGIAAVRQGPKLTHTGGFVGTPAYMSPEQIKGEPLDGRSDFYSLGIVLYELFAGKRPFDTDEVTALMYKQVHEAPPPLHKQRPDLKPETLAIVKKLMAKEPDKRFADAAALIKAIDAAIKAEGGYGPNPVATQVLTQLADGLLISRSQLDKRNAKAGAKLLAVRHWLREVPKWVYGCVIVIFLGLIALAVVNGGNAWAGDDPTIPAVAVVPSATATDTLIAVPTVAKTAVPTQITPLPPPTDTPKATLTLPPTDTAPPPTDTPIPVTPDANETAIACEGASPTRLNIGGRATTINSQVSVLEEPRSRAGVVNTLLPGRIVEIIGGPTCADRQLWYQVRSLPFENTAGETIPPFEGWIAEESGDTYFLQPEN
ncbi:MAG: hypothetical protein DHS20C20_14130 [Ardenticatenaceae bacterium]|nr:MAG: hypothetical protein DHS20C20_14130 [Ardenticatenaceae bacterium]